MITDGRKARGPIKSFATMSVPPPSLGGTAVGGALVGSALAAAAGALVAAGAAGAAGAAASSSSEPHAMAVIANSPTSKLMTIKEANLFERLIFDLNMKISPNVGKLHNFNKANAAKRIRGGLNDAQRMS